MKDLTVLASANDPYRFDTPARHRDAEWLVEQIDRLNLRRPIHLRGLHYILASSADAVRPNGQRYINDESCWNWLGRGLITAQPQPDAGELDHGGERAGELVVARGDAAELLQLIKEALDPIACLVEPAAEAKARFARASRGDVG
jgi:hypothetical protein